MNFQQLGYTQALWDLGFQKEAGILDSAARAAKSLFTRAPATAMVAPESTAMRAALRPTVRPGVPTPTQREFMEGLKSRTVEPQTPFRTLAEQTPSATVAPAARAKNLPGYDPATVRLQAAPKTPVNIAHQNQFAGAYPQQAAQFRQADQLLQAQSQTPVVNSLFQNRAARPGLQEAMGLFT
jgi:hypothetical protein